MRRGHSVGWSAAALCAILVSACATTTTPPKPAVVALQAKGCDAALTLAFAKTIAPEKPYDAHVEEHELGPSDPCVVNDEGTAGYFVIFALPKERPATPITVRAPREEERILALAVSTLDADGDEVRAFDRETFVFRGGALSVQFTPRQTEAFIAVRSDADLAGDLNTGVRARLVGTQDTVTTSAGSSSYTWFDGTDTAYEQTFSHTGVVQVKLSHVPKDQRPKRR